MKSILVPLDFSDCSRLALAFAGNLASKTGAKIHLLHVLEAPSFYPMDINISGDLSGGGSGGTSDVPYMVGLLTEVKIKMKKELKRPVLKGLKVQDEIEIGNPSSSIIKAAKKYKADIIIMGSHGASGFNEFFIGSNAEKVVRLADRPVFTIKHKITNNNIKKIVFATDFSKEAYKVFPTIQAFADIFKAQIFIIKVNSLKKFKNSREDQQELDKFVASLGNTKCNATIYNDSVQEAGIIHYADDISADMIAIGTHGRTGISIFFNHSISEDLVNHSFLPILTVNFGKK